MRGRAEGIFDHMAMIWTHRGALALTAIFVAPVAFASPLPSCAGASEAAGVQVVRVEKKGALILDDGRAVHVEGLLLPAGGADKAPEFLAGQALNELSELSHDRG